MIIPASTLNAAEYRCFCDLVRARSGLEFDSARRPDLERAIQREMAERRLDDPGSLYQMLVVSPDALDPFIESLTIPETYFFRNTPQIEALERHILPDLIARRRAVRSLRIWSAGCASGEEPYTVAILLRRLLSSDFDAWNILILGTDINRSLLQKARRGLYTAWSLRDTSADLRKRYFVQCGDQFELKPEIRSQVTFARLNLAADSYPSPLTNTHDLDLILFRNVLIYFGPQMTQHVVARIHDALVEGGWLIVGHAEPSVVTFGQFTAHSFPGTVIYQKAASPASSGTGHMAALPGGLPSPAEGHLPAPKRASKPRARRASHPRAATPSRPSDPPLTATVDALVAEYQMAKAQADQLQSEDARRTVASVIEQAPLYAPAYYLMGLIHQEAGESDEAMAAFRRCVYVDPGFVMGHLVLADLYAARGQPQRARKHRENAIAVLRRCAPADMVPEGDGLTVADLLQAIDVADDEGADHR